MKKSLISPIRVLCVVFGLFLTGCQTAYYSPKEQNSVKPVRALSELEVLPLPSERISIAVYDFPDLTGAFKSNDAFAVYSKAVPQGSDTIVIDALLRAGNGGWFNVLERKGLNALVQERKIDEVNQTIRRKSQLNSQNLLSSLQDSLSEKNVNFKVSNSLGNIPTKSRNPLKINPQTNFGFNQQTSKPQQSNQSVSFGDNNKLLQSADYIIEGGIVGYDSDEVTGGGGLRLLNIGGFGEIRKDIVTVNMRLVDVKTGNIVLNRTLSKGIYSQKLQGSSFGYVDVDKILETEIGFSHNEPVFEALNLTIQTAVLDLIKQGVARNLWQYQQTNIPNVLSDPMGKNLMPEKKPIIIQKMSPIATLDNQTPINNNAYYTLANASVYY